MVDDFGILEYIAAKDIISQLQPLGPLYVTLAGACIAMPKRKEPLASGAVVREDMEHLKLFQKYGKELLVAIGKNMHDQEAKKDFVMGYSYDQLTDAAQCLLGIIIEYSPVGGIPQQLWDKMEHQWLQGSSESR